MIYIISSFLKIKLSLMKRNFAIWQLRYGLGMNQHLHISVQKGKKKKKKKHVRFGGEKTRRTKGNHRYFKALNPQILLQLQYTLHIPPSSLQR